LNLKFGTLFLLMLACGKMFAGIGVELDVAFKDTTVQCRYLYVLCPTTDGTNDTLAIFDSLSFNGKNRVSLFYSVRSSEKNTLLMIDSTGMKVESNNFKILPRRTTFSVVVGQQRIEVVAKDYLHLRKNENEQSYYIFLLIFFVVKLIITVVFVLTSKLPGHIISIACGAFLLSAFIDWLFPINYLYRFLMIILAEYLMIAVIGHKSISKFRVAILVLIVNIAGFGIIDLLYLLYVFY